LGKLLVEVTSLEAQLTLSYLVWPGEAPDPRVVDAWVRRQGLGGNETLAVLRSVDRFCDNCESQCP
jgi:hypothetical protein